MATFGLVDYLHDLIFLQFPAQSQPRVHRSDHLTFQLPNFTHRDCPGQRWRQVTRVSSCRSTQHRHPSSVPGWPAQVRRHQTQRDQSWPSLQQNQPRLSATQEEESEPWTRDWARSREIKFTIWARTRSIQWSVRIIWHHCCRRHCQLTLIQKNNLHTVIEMKIFQLLKYLLTIFQHEPNCFISATQVGLPE